jgi:agmatinase
MRKVSAQNLWAGLNRPDMALKYVDAAILGIPHDGAVFFRKGAAKAPKLIREFSVFVPPVLEDGTFLDNLIVKDLGDFLLTKDVDKSHNNVREKIMDMRKHTVPVVVGGDHSVSIPVIHALSDHFSPDPIGIVYFDAHPDMNDLFEGSKLSHACVLRRALENKTVHAKNMVLIGVRSFEKEEVEFLKQNKIEFYTAQDVYNNGVKWISKRILKKMRGLKHVYVDVDIDVLDPAFAPSTGIPDAGGLSTRELLEIMNGITKLNFVGFNVVEVAPPLDPSHITSFAATKILVEFLGILQRKKEPQSIWAKWRKTA